MQDNNSQKEITELDIRILNAFQENIMENTSPRCVRDAILEMIVEATTHYEGDNIRNLSSSFCVLQDIYNFMNDVEFRKSMSPKADVTKHNLSDYVKRCLVYGKSFQINLPNGIWSYSYSNHSKKGEITLINPYDPKSKEVSLKEITEEVVRLWGKVVHITD